MLKTQGEFESLVCNGVAQIMSGVLGRGPKTIKCHIFQEMVYLRVWNEYSKIESQLILSENGGNILKNYRNNMVLGVRDVFEKMISGVFDIKLINLHHDITVANGEEILIFTLESIPNFTN